MMEYYDNLKLSSPADRALVEVVYKQVEKLYKAPIHIFYTDHTVQHSLRVQKYISKILEGVDLDGENRTLTEDEKVTLLSAILLHDIGMQTTKYIEHYDSANPLTISQLDDIRKKHHEYSAKLIYESINCAPGDRYYLGLEIRHDLVDYIATVAKHHRKCNIELLTEPIVAGDPIRTKLLSALLRLGDCLDFDYRRVDIDTLQSIDIPDESKLRWYCHYFVQGIGIENQIITVQFRFPEVYQDSDYQQAVIKYVKREIEREMDEVYDVLYRNGVRLHKNIYSETRYSLTVKRMPENLEKHIKNLSHKLKTAIQNISIPLAEHCPQLPDKFIGEIGNSIKEFGNVITDTITIALNTLEGTRGYNREIELVGGDSNQSVSIDVEKDKGIFEFELLGSETADIYISIPPQCGDNREYVLYIFDLERTANKIVGESHIMVKKYKGGMIAKINNLKAGKYCATVMEVEKNAQ